ncbi:MAG UNVERIFIED_CONTAM: hypothetical protein LVR18_40670 [Planctomycetaceae bacterium]
MLTVLRDAGFERTTQSELRRLLQPDRTAARATTQCRRSLFESPTAKPQIAEATNVMTNSSASPTRANGSLSRHRKDRLPDPSTSRPDSGETSDLADRALRGGRG